MKNLLPKCPICNCPAQETEKYCRRCECDLALLRGVFTVAERLEREGKLLQCKTLIGDLQATKINV